MNHHTYEKPLEEKIQTLVSRSYESLDEGEALAQQVLLLGRATRMSGSRALP